jgi:hydrogenase/urease accessory protein HupE
VAHLVSTRFGEFYSGMLHPVTTLQHLLPWLALGLLGGLQAPTTARWALLTFPLGALIGVGLATVLPELPLVEPLNLLSFVVLGVLVALKLPLGLTLFLSLALMLGLTQGYANAAAGYPGFEGLLHATGVALSAYLVITLTAGSANALACGPTWGTVAVRATGSWIAAAGTMYAGYLLTAA